MSTILVTGGLGYVGSHFVWAAASAGVSPVVLDDGSTAGEPLLPPGVEVVRGDIGDGELIRRTCSRIRAEAVVHFAGKALVGESMRNPAATFDVNVTRGLRLLDGALAAGVGNIVFSSSAAVYGEPEGVPIPEGAPTRPLNPYGASKLCFELALAAYAQAYGLRWAALRYFNAAGARPDGALREEHEPETHLIPLVLDAGLGRRPPVTVFGADYPTPDGTCIRDFVHVCDLADAHLRALERLVAGRSLGPINLGTGMGHSVRQVIVEAERVLGRSVPHVLGPRRIGDPAFLIADSTLAGTVLGWRAVRSELAVILEDALLSRTGPTPQASRVGSR